MTPLVWGDLAVGFGIPLLTATLYFAGRIQTRHVWMMVWGFAVGSTWEFAFYFLDDAVHTMRIEWPLPIITLHLSHTFWDAGLFIVGYLLYHTATADLGGRADRLLPRSHSH